MVSIAQLKEVFLAGKLILHCSTIELRQCDQAKEPKIYSGSGAIALNPVEGFYGSFVSEVIVPMFAQLLEDQKLIRGEIIPDSYYYSLEATSYDGTVWKNPKVAVKVSGGDKGTKVEFHLDYLETSRSLQTTRNAHASFVFLELLPFQLTAATHTTEKGPIGEQIKFHRDYGVHQSRRMRTIYRERKDGVVHSELTAEFYSEVPVGFQTRLIEAARFVTAVSASWVMLEYRRDGMVHLELSPHAPSQNHLVNAPLSKQHMGPDTYRMFEAYYVHSCGKTSGEDFSQLSTAIGPLFALKGLNFSEICLVVGVAIEALLKDEFADVASVESELMGEVELVLQMIDSVSGVREGTKKRLKGSLGGVKTARPKDKLLKLHELGLITSSELKDWESLRNKSAHGSLRIHPQQEERLLQQVFTVTTLAYKLAFLRIGYFGPYTDYGSRGWHTAWFPAKGDANDLAKTVDQLSQLQCANDVQDKLDAWQAVESALRNTIEDRDAGASRLLASLSLLATMRTAGQLRLAELLGAPNSRSSFAKFF